MFIIHLCIIIAILFQYNNNTIKILRQYFKIMTKEELDKIKENLPVGYRESLSTATELSVVTIDKVLAGERQNLKVIRAAIDLAKQHKEELSRLQMEINNL